jgi:hypothetical protein
MALLDTFKEKVLDLGRTEARAKARPLLIDDETFDRSAAGLDRRGQESYVLFWLLSDRALFLVGGGPGGDHAFRVPFEALGEVSLDFDENAGMLPWYIRVAMSGDGPGTITTLQEVRDPGSPLAAPPPRDVGAEERQRLARGEIMPLSGFASLTRKFRSALKRRLQLAGKDLHVTGEEAASRRRPQRKRSRGSQ